MTFVILPNYIYDEITAKLATACTAHPQMTDEDKTELRAEIVRFVDEHGYVPDFSVQKKADT